MAKQSNLQLFLSKVSKVLKKNQIISQKEEHLEYLYSCIDVKKVISAVLKPKSKEEVQSIVLLANTYSISLYPISRGNNWGYGTKNPVKNNSVIVDLSLMNSIIEFDNTLGYVRIEPGVTQQQLYDYLEKNNSEFQMDPTGSAPSTSVLANALERGFGIGVYNNHFESLSNLEIVMPDSTLLQTGFGHYDNSKTKEVYKYGVGPFMDGIFSQSNLGIVTSGTMHLAPKTQCIEMMALRLDSNEVLGDVIDVMQKLRIKGICKATVNVLYGKRVLTTKIRFPNLKSSESRLSDSIYKHLLDEHDVGHWNIVTALYGTKEEVALAKKMISKSLKGVSGRLSFISERKLDFIYANKKLLSPILSLINDIDIDSLYDTLKRTFSIMGGKPSTASMRSPYFRSNKEFNEKDPNPAKDNCGLYWISPILPFRKEDVLKSFDLGEKICKKYGFDFCPTYSMASGRCIDNTIPLIYNKDDREETKRAAKCNEELILEHKKLGYVIYRSGISSMKYIVDKDDSFWKVKKKIKEALDPNSIIAPGRYE